MSRTIAPAPVRRSVRVKAAPARAFEVFTARMSNWWAPTHSINKSSPMKEAIIEPRVGGRWFERGEDGSECQWGRVLVWEPPSRLVLAWQIDGAWQYDPALVTEVEVQFLPDGPDATRVELEHRNLDRFGERGAALRESFDSPGGWQGLLDRFAALAAG